MGRKGGGVGGKDRSDRGSYSIQYPSFLNFLPKKIPTFLACPKTSANFIIHLLESYNLPNRLESQKYPIMPHKQKITLNMLLLI